MLEVDQFQKFKEAPVTTSRFRPFTVSHVSLSWNLGLTSKYLDTYSYQLHKARLYRRGSHKSTFGAITDQKHHGVLENRQFTGRRKREQGSWKAEGERKEASEK